MPLFEYEKRLLDSKAIMDPETRAEKAIINMGIELAARAYGIDYTVEVRYPNSDEETQFKKVWESQRSGTKDVMTLSQAIKKFRRIFKDFLEDRANNLDGSPRGNLYDKVYRYNYSNSNSKYTYN